MSESLPVPLLSTEKIQQLVYVIRSQQVMLDSDLAMLYQVETGALNRAVKRNKYRFPDDFCFQLTIEELTSLRCQIGISKKEDSGNTSHGGRRYTPYVFTEQGIAMLASVLRSEIAAKVNVQIMRTFVTMRRFIANNTMLFTYITELEMKQEKYINESDKKFKQVFDYIAAHTESEQKIFYDSQIFDAFSFFINLVSKATTSIILIDGYVDIDTLNIFTKKKTGVTVDIYTLPKSSLSKTDINNFNKQYPRLTVCYNTHFHDRFMIIDNIDVYHIGASLKDAGKKCFAVTKLNDPSIAQDIKQRL
ncbi:MAG: ORF6N domain-containing protein [Clostridia bacterium]|nr:ORF6N domain-containing protein [Clostridia bacterium]HQO69041.1 ORF6N domain-containing protein [Clostridia bacterium]